MGRELRPSKSKTTKRQLGTVAVAEKRVALHSVAQKSPIPSRASLKREAAQLRKAGFHVTLTFDETSGTLRIESSPGITEHMQAEKHSFRIGWKDKENTVLSFNADVNVNSEEELLLGWYLLKSHTRRLDKELAKHFHRLGRCMYCGEKIPEVDVCDANSRRERAARSDRRYCPPALGTKSQPCKTNYHRALKADLASSGREAKIFHLYRRRFKSTASR